MSAHRPEFLIKYCDAETGLQILNANTLRWSAPCLYQDPMELNHHSQLPFSNERLLQMTVQTATSMLFAKEPPRGSAPLLNAIRRWRDEERFGSPEEAYEVLGELLGQVVDQRLGVLEEVRRGWLSYASNLRICSFSSKPDNATCWGLFADQHRGLGIRFVSDEDSELPPPVKVQYNKPRPEISSLNEEIAAIINGTRYLASEHFEEKFAFKPDYCSEEREWRCFRATKNANAAQEIPDGERYSDMPFDPSAVTAVYFGIATPEQVKENVGQLLKSKYPRARMFQASLAPGKYQLDLERL